MPAKAAVLDQMENLLTWSSLWVELLFYSLPLLLDFSVHILSVHILLQDSFTKQQIDAMTLWRCFQIYTVYVVVLQMLMLYLTGLLWTHSAFGHLKNMIHGKWCVLDQLALTLQQELANETDAVRNLVCRLTNMTEWQCSGSTEELTFSRAYVLYHSKRKRKRNSTVCCTLTRHV